MPPYDVIVIGAGAAGMMCAVEAGKRGRRTLVLDHAAVPGEKIRISGGGRCNFTNLHTAPESFLSDNPRFCVSALTRFTPKDFVALVERHGIPYHEKTLGQLFCDDSSRRVIDMLLAELRTAGAELRLKASVAGVGREGEGYAVRLAGGEALACASLVIATGGLSIPKIGATGFAYDVAASFGLNIVPTRPGLVPFLLGEDVLPHVKGLAGVSVDGAASCGKVRFREGILFTHRGLSGPAVLQASSYWREGEEIVLDLAPETDAFALLKRRKAEGSKQEIATALAEFLPKRAAQALCEYGGIRGRTADLPHKTLEKAGLLANRLRLVPSGTEGYRTAEVTLGGVDTAELSSRTMEAHRMKGLYFVGEAVDVTGRLGGFNFQWAWASGAAAGREA
jgi:predicted Rossmann fold flavoprotein